MNPTPRHLNDTIREIVTTLRTHLWLWLVPAMICTAMTTTYALIRPNVWRASQALWVRDEAAGSLGGQGEFDDTDSKKAALETIIELSKNHKVVANALKQVGPRGKAPRDWPLRADIDALRGAVAVVSPQGKELGGTEHVYLTVSNRDPQRATALAAAIAEQMEHRWQELRRAKAQSVIGELTRTRQLAAADLDQANQRLELLERQIGSDLGELRSLNDAASGSSNLRTTQQEIATELRQLKSKVVTNQELLDLLVTARRDPENLIAAPNQLLDAQPALRRLKEGLVDAQLRTANLRGMMSDAHPRVRAALAAEREVRDNLRRELQIAVVGLQAELDVNEKLVRSLSVQQQRVESRLHELASVRTHYARLSADVRHRQQLLEQAQQQLSEANARQAAAATTSLLTALDQPLVASHPVGPSRKTLVAGGALGGLAIGWGLVLLLRSTAGQQRRRWTDYLRSGRRTSDLAGRRDADREADARADVRHGNTVEDRRRSTPTPEPPSPTDTLASQPHPAATPATAGPATATASSRRRPPLLAAAVPSLRIRSDQGSTEVGNDLTLTESLKRLDALRRD